MPIAVTLTILCVIYSHLGDEGLPTKLSCIQFVAGVGIKIGAYTADQFCCCGLALTRTTHRCCTVWQFVTDKFDFWSGQWNTRETNRREDEVSRYLWGFDQFSWQSVRLARSLTINDFFIVIGNRPRAKNRNPSWAQNSGSERSSQNGENRLQNWWVVSPMEGNGKVYIYVPKTSSIIGRLEPPPLSSKSELRHDENYHAGSMWTWCQVRGSHYPKPMLTLPLFNQEAIQVWYDAFHLCN